MTYQTSQIINPKHFFFADDTSIIITNPNPLASRNEINEAFKGINDWFNAKFIIIKC
jgi:hypothetical protein